MTGEGLDLIIRYIWGVLVILLRIFLCSYSPLSQCSVCPGEGCKGSERGRGEAVRGATEGTWSVHPGAVQWRGH